MKPSQKQPKRIVAEATTTGEAGVELTYREARLPPNLRGLRQKLGRKAKQEKRFRFYSL